jgi:endonuclease/exonuclease/phosphatase family metal-dependent hydrolase
MHWCRALALVLAMLPLATFAGPSAQEGEEPSPPAAPAAAAQRLTFFHMNIAGNMLHAGRTENIAPAVINSITSSWPSVVSLQEVCEQQFKQIYWEVNRLGGRYEARFAHTQENRRPCQGGFYGDVLMTRGVNNTWNEQILPFQNRDSNGNLIGDLRKVVCVTTGFALRIIACAAHLEPSSLRSYANMDWIGKNFLIPYANFGVPTVFLGDTYLNEAYMRWYTGGIFAHTVLGNTYNNPDCTRPTYTAPEEHPRGFKCGGPSTTQYDYIMVSTNRFSGWSGEVTRTKWSDHLPVRGAATVR